MNEEVYDVWHLRRGTMSRKSAKCDNLGGASSSSHVSKSRLSRRGHWKSWKIANWKMSGSWFEKLLINYLPWNNQSFYCEIGSQKTRVWWFNSRVLMDIDSSFSSSIVQFHFLLKTNRRWWHCGITQHLNFMEVSKLRTVFLSTLNATWSVGSIVKLRHLLIEFSP